uniref:Uncharacterized protein n=1 Tax=Tanacetum cinerariifolium TaxID=118510 RepID=A0A6L2K9Q8_TANCI|nr:hypothetical protein [Tanacetum cinerariifolium]
MVSHASSALNSLRSPSAAKLREIHLDVVGTSRGKERWKKSDDGLNSEFVAGSKQHDKKVNFHKLETEQTELDDVLIPMSSVPEGRKDYGRALVDISIDRALKDTMAISIPNPIGTTSNDGFQTIQKKAPCGPLANKNGKGGRQVGKHVVFSPRTKLHYFDRDDMELMTWNMRSRKWSMASVDNVITLDDFKIVTDLGF